MSRANLNELSVRCHAISKSKGFYDSPVSPITQLALIVTEVAEAIEAERVGDHRLRITESGKPEGTPSELVDVIIRVLDMCASLNIDIDEAVSKKLDYNETRSRMHGGKKF